jgi:HrpA-like RNA helicase
VSHGEEILDLINDKETSRYVESEHTFKTANQETLDVSENAVPLKFMAPTIAHVAKTTPSGGAILAFLPGMAEIKALDLFLSSKQLLGVNCADGSKFK